ncbi:MAG: DUF364 domain-containing protein [Candidatus Cloacimonadales bacterium]
MQIKQEPLAYFLDKYGLDFSQISSFRSGQKYSVILLQDGKIGICGNLDGAVKSELSWHQNLDLQQLDTRIFVNCYFNAKFNNSGADEGEDLLKIVDFQQYKQIVMIGNFHPIVAKFQRRQIKADIFDLKEDAAYLQPMSKQKTYLQQADCVILTATTISNGTFMQILKNSNDRCEIFLLGPSTPMHRDMLQYRNIKHLFGTSFARNNQELLEVIAVGQGPRYFLKFGSKTMLLDKDERK